MSHYCSSSPHVTTGIILSKQLYAWEFFTRSLPYFTEIHTIFYANGIKIIPEDIYNLLIPIALAQLIMGDGYVERPGLTICTDSYSVEEVLRLINVLIIRYRLECTIRVHKKINIEFIYDKIIWHHSLILFFLICILVCYIKLILKIRSVAPPEVTQLRERGVLYPFRGADKSGILHGVVCEDLVNRRNEFQIFAWEEKYLKLNF